MKIHEKGCIEHKHEFTFFFVIFLRDLEIDRKDLCM